MRFQVIADRSLLIGSGAPPGNGVAFSLLRSNRPMRSFVEPPILDPYFAANKLSLVVLDLERVEIFPDQEQPALAGVDVRIDAVQQVLIDDDRAYRFGRMRLLIDIDSIDGGVAGQR